VRLRPTVLVAAALLALPSTASAHVELSPDRVEPGSFTLFTVLSPDEAASPLTGLQLTFPPALEVDSVADTPGFTTTLITDQTHRITGVSWRGGSVAPGHLALFHFSASVPPASTVVHMIGVQSFADGSTKLWRSPQIEVQAAAAATGTSHPSDTLARVLAAAALAAAVTALLVAWRRR
jgi:periplasmic copper chaperone A